jgi:Ca2+-binding RTX toxin-like protein
MKTTPATRTRLELESLDGRIVPATIAYSAGVVTITGDPLYDTCTVTQTGPTTLKVAVRSTVPASSISFTKTRLYTASAVNKIVFFGGAGADRFTNHTSKPSYASGDGGNDVLIGGSGRDTFAGGSGNDTLLGVAGNDTLFGGDGNDYLNGGAGNDYLVGESGDDKLYGLGGQDRLYGVAGKDELHGGLDGQRDFLYGGSSGDRFKSDGAIEFFFDYIPAQGDTII